MTTASQQLSTIRPLFHQNASVSSDSYLLSNIHFIMVSKRWRGSRRKKFFVSTSQTIGTSFIFLILQTTTKPPLAGHTLKRSQAFRITTSNINSMFLCDNPSTRVVRAYTFYILHLFLHSLPLLSGQACSSQQAFATRGCRSGQALRGKKRKPGRVYVLTFPLTSFISYPIKLIFIRNTK